MPARFLPATLPLARAALTTLLLGGAAAPAAAQRLVRPERDWVTLRTPHFRFHSPREMLPWTRSVAERMEAIRAAELPVIGTVPPGVTDVVVEDPLNDPNGSAYPFLREPAIFLWPVPPTPRSFVGNARAWGELLAVHEFAHVAHLVRPSRNRLDRAWRVLLPGRIGPIATRSPRWAIEGYATYVEGVLTGTGRPHGAQRAAVLRQWALEGRMPGYTALSAGGSGYLAGSQAYLTGSAFLEWLGAERGDSAITALWRRLSARERRSFDAAFAGVWGESPAALYGRFTAQVTAAAFAAQARVDSAGRVEGALHQRLARGTGDPALSRDGRRMAVVLAGGAGQPSRLVVWRAGPEAARDTAADSAYARGVRRLRRRDPEDVPAVRLFPPALRPVATLQAVSGRGHVDPRFLPDGRLLVTRDEPTPDGQLRPDLFVWDTAGTLRRVTHGAAVRQGDPSPDGRRAAAVRCAIGSCDLVLVDLTRGAVSVLRRGAPDVAWTRPRWSPDGTRLVAGVQRGGRWRLVLVDPARADGDLPLGPDDGAERYDAAFTPDGQAIVYVSEAGGIPNVTRLALAPGAPEEPLTRVTSAAAAPEPSAAEEALYYLHLRPHGMDLRRLEPARTPVRGGIVAVQTAPALLPRTAAAAVSSAIAQRPPVPGPTYAAGTVDERAYGAGPRHLTAVPFGTVSPGGGAVGLQLGSTDPAGRLTWLAQGALAERRAWEGAALRAAWRGLPVIVTAEGFALRQDLAASPGTGGGPVPLGLRDDARWSGGALTAEATRVGAAGGGSTRGLLGLPSLLDYRLTFRAGASLGRLTLVPGSGGDELALRARQAGERRTYFVELGAGTAGAYGTSRLGLTLSGHAAGGQTLGGTWRRARAAASVTAGTQALGLTVDGLFGRTSADAPAWEQFAVGGQGPGMIDDAFLSQRVHLPALPPAYRTGRAVGLVRAGLRVPVGVAGLQPYAAALQAGGDLQGRWARLVGLEARSDTPFAPFARAPRARLLFGIGWLVDEPLRDRVRGYGGLTFQP